MGNDSAKLIHCFSGDTRHHHIAAAVTSEPYDEALATPSATFAPMPSPPPPQPPPRFITPRRPPSSGPSPASLSAPTQPLLSPPPLPTSLARQSPLPPSRAPPPSPPSPSSLSLASPPAPLSGPLAPVNQGFLSGSIERGFMSIPLDHRTPSGCLHRSRSHGLALRRHSCRFATFLLRGFTKGIARTMPPPFSQPPSHLLPLVAAPPIPPRM